MITAPAASGILHDNDSRVAIIMAVAIQKIAARAATSPIAGTRTRIISRAGVAVKPTLRMNCRNVPPRKPAADVPAITDTIM